VPSQNLSFLNLDISYGKLLKNLKEEKVTPSVYKKDLLLVYVIGFVSCIKQCNDELV
jgi:hypothetical protein